MDSTSCGASYACAVVDHFFPLSIPSPRSAGTLKLRASLPTILRVIYLCATSTDSMARAHIATQGSKRTAFLMATSVIQRTLYLVGP